MTNEMIYVRLLDEGVSVLRPAEATRHSANVFTIAMSEEYDPIDEKWEFVPGTTVRCEPQTVGGETILVAVAAVADPA